MLHKLAEELSDILSFRSINTQLIIFWGNILVDCLNKGNRQVILYMSWDYISNDFIYNFLLLPY